MPFSNFDIQRLLSSANQYDGQLDGDLGPKSWAGIKALLASYAPPAAKTWSETRQCIAACQIVLKAAGYYTGIVDGYAGMLTKFAYERWQYKDKHGVDQPIWRPDVIDVAIGPEIQIVDNDWGPQREVEKRFGKAGGPQCTSGKVNLPYKMKLAWNKREVISKFSCHEKVARSVERVLTRVAHEYSADQISNLGLDLFGGCYNYRPMRGGKALSMHAYGLAIDFNPELNQLKWSKARASMAKPAFEKFWKAWEDEGWTSLGRRKDFDWMHVQAPSA